jgi:HEAT repeat protein
MRSIILAICLSFLLLGCKKGGGSSADQTPEKPTYEGKSAADWLTQFKEGDPAGKAKAAEALAALGPGAKETIPDLTKALTDEESRVHASEALGSMGPDAIPPLVNALGEPSIGARRQAAKALASIGAEAVPALRRALKDKNVNVRQEAAVALGLIGPAAADAVADLVSLLEDEEKWVRNYAAEALGLIGPKAKQAVKALETLKDDPTCRARAAEALKLIGE